MELYEYNIYAYGRLIVFPDQTQLLFPQIKDIPTDPKDIFHTVVDGDTYDKIAYKYWYEVVPNSHRYWWLIYLANGGGNPFTLADRVGERIRVPYIHFAIGNYE